MPEKTIHRLCRWQRSQRISDLNMPELIQARQIPPLLRPPSVPPGTLHFTLPPRSWHDHGFRQNEGPYDSEKEVKGGFKSPAKITARPLICWREETGERLSSKPQISQAGILPSPRLASARLSSPNTYSSSPLAGSLGPALTHQETTQGQPGQPWQHHTARQLWSRGSQAKLQPCFPLQGSF